MSLFAFNMVLLGLLRTVSACRNVLVLLSFPIIMLYLFWTPGVRGNHNKWWTCNDACSRCVRRVTPIDDMLTQLYPGLFSFDPPASYAPDGGFLNSIQLPITASTGNNSAGDKPQPYSPTVNDSSNSTGKNKTEFVDSTAITIRPQPRNPEVKPKRLECCETEMAYITPENITIRGHVYKVVHLRRMFQFIPIGKCRPGSSCTNGECVERARGHYILVVNDTLGVDRHFPFTFAPIEVPSHCECMNIG